MAIIEKTFGVSGMTCDGCERSVARALQLLDGVEEAKPSHTAGTVVVRYDESRLGDEQIGAAIEDAGYELATGDRPSIPNLIKEIGFGKPDHP